MYIDESTYAESRVQLAQRDKCSQKFGIHNLSCGEKLQRNIMFETWQYLPLNDATLTQQL